MFQGEKVHEATGQRGATAGAGAGGRRNGWHVAQTGTGYTVSRRWPARFDIRVCTRMPQLDHARLAMQIRQDLWRELRHLRGFSPAVEIVADEAGLTVCVGGRLLAGRAPSGTSARVAAMLDDPVRQARWQAWAAPRERT